MPVESANRIEVIFLKKKWLATLHGNPLYKARQLQAIAYASMVLNVFLILILILIMGVR